MLQNFHYQNLKRFQLSKFQENKPVSRKTSTQQCTEYIECWLNQQLNYHVLNQHGVYAKIKNTPNGSPDPIFPNLIDIDCKLLVSPTTLQVTCPKNPEKANFLGVNAEKTDKNPSDIYIQALYYGNGRIALVGFAYRESLEYYPPDRAIPMEATYRVYREYLININELPKTLVSRVNNNTSNIKYV